MVSMDRGGLFVLVCVHAWEGSEGGPAALAYNDNRVRDLRVPRINFRYI